MVENFLKTVFNLIPGCNLQSYGIVETGNAYRMHPEESKSFLMELLKFSNPEFPLDQIPEISELICGVSRSTGNQLWATDDEIAEFSDKITRSL